MKNFINKINRKLTALAVKTQTAIENKKAEMYVDKGIGIIIAVVVGAIVLAGVYAVIKTNVLAGLGGKVDGLWNYTA